MGKLHVKRSSRLANSIHSCANTGPETASANTAETSGVRRILFLLRRRLASRSSTSFGAAFVAINLVAVRTRIVQLLTDVDEGLCVPRLRCATCKLSDINQLRHVLLPVRAIDRNGPAILTFPSRRQQKRRGFAEGDGSLINRE